MPKDSKEDLVRKNPTLADKVHCILYVIHANSNLTSKRTASIKLMKEIKDSKNNEGIFFKLTKQVNECSIRVIINNIIWFFLFT